MKVKFKVRKLTKLQAAEKFIAELAEVNKAYCTEVRELRAAALARANADAKIPYRRLTVQLEDASGKPLSGSITYINRGDAAYATVDVDGNIKLTTDAAGR